MGNSNPYLQPNRLSDVIAAIQAMGVYKYYKLSFAAWSDRISGDERNADHWQRVFEEHSEFFRLDSKRQKASLVVRRQHPKRYDIDSQQLITREEFYSRTDISKISRSPLLENEIASLIQTAVRLHSHALEEKRDAKLLFQIVVPTVASLIGVVLGAFLRGG